MSQENKTYFVYILKSEKDKKRYIGSTNNLQRRIAEHNRGTVKSTKFRRPFKMVYKEQFQTQKEAEDREKFFKTGRGRQFIKEVLQL
ncbi:MAG: GIY-YIG nuclease family protein [Calditrichia bacterium]|nr:GIY-YIG nuclease family protein [Calditrichia bacterium]